MLLSASPLQKSKDLLLWIDFCLRGLTVTEIPYATCKGTVVSQTLQMELGRQSRSYLPFQINFLYPLAFFARS